MIIGLPTLAISASLMVQDGSEPHGVMLRFPDVSATQVVFAYSNDLWIVSRDGGVASPLSSPKGSEAFPRFDAAGGRIAFMGNYDGNTDLYVLPTAGGSARRVTYHGGAETLCDWTPDGELLYFTSGYSFSRRITELFTVSAEGGASERVPVPYGANASLNASGEWMAYTPVFRDGRTWKRYAGGMAADVWLFNLKTHASRRVTSFDGTDTLPMWGSNFLYYLSDAGSEHRLNLWRWNPRTGSTTQLTHFEDDDLRWPSMGPGSDGQGEIIFQHGSSLKIFDLTSSAVRSLSVTIPGDAAGLRPVRVDASEFIQNVGLSATGKRVCIEARGDLWSLPAEKGTTRNLTRTAGIAEREPTWSPCGRWIAYLSDQTGEYELYVTQSDGKGETRQITDDGGSYRLDLRWSPDSKWITFSENSGELKLVNVETKVSRLIDQSPLGVFGGIPNPNWSHDSRWFAYARMSDHGMSSLMFLYEVESGERHALTSGSFSDSSPTFDRMGDWLYYVSDREFSPTYSSLDTTWVYRNTQRLLAVPLREDVADPWPLENDEETWEDEESAEGEGEESSEGEGEESGDEAAASEADKEGEDAAEDDGFSGTWEGSVEGEELPDGSMSMNLILSLGEDGSVTGTVVALNGNATFAGEFDAATGTLRGKLTGDDGMVFEVEAAVEGSTMSGTLVAADGVMTFTFECVRSDSSSSDDAGEGKARETVDVDLEGFEARAILLPTPAGSYSNLITNDKSQLLYVRGESGGRGGGGGGAVKLFDLKEKAEKEVAAGVQGFSMSADGKKILFGEGGSIRIQNAAAGGGAKPVSTKAMTVSVDLKVEWRQVFREAWRLNRQYFYDPHMHGVDWDAVYAHYSSMIEDCATREDVEFLIGEAISELNVGHAYARGAPGFERGDSISVGTLGVDFALENGRHRIVKIHRGAAWDTDARSPFDRPGVTVEEGDYLLAVDGVPLDPKLDPYAAFQGKAGLAVELLVNSTPTEDEAREIRVTTLGDDRDLRYRGWIERNRRTVEEKSGGRIGYIYVPDTSVPGQNDLVRQFQGALGKEAILVDERWNSGGQIPTRFVELLGRKQTNAWAVRSPGDLQWPPVHHDGPKAMLINGWSGSGGDAFPAYFRQFGLGKLIGRRTWGGLVGISGNPTLIDGGAISVPTFAYYENDGTWGIEGHGVEPDLDVLDDPAQMWDGGDPQLDAGIEHLLGLLEGWPQPAGRPEYPKRGGMGIAEEDK